MYRSATNHILHTLTVQQQQQHITASLSMFRNQFKPEQKWGLSGSSWLIALSDECSTKPSICLVCQLCFSENYSYLVKSGVQLEHYSTPIRGVHYSESFYEVSIFLVGLFQCIPLLGSLKNTIFAMCKCWEVHAAYNHCLQFMPHPPILISITLALAFLSHTLHVGWSVYPTY